MPNGQASLDRLIKCLDKCKDKACQQACEATFVAEGGQVSINPQGGKVFTAQGGKVFVLDGGKVFQ